MMRGQSLPSAEVGSVGAFRHASQAFPKFRAVLAATHSELEFDGAHTASVVGPP